MVTRFILRASLLLCLVLSLFPPAFSQSVTVSPTSISFGNQPEGTSSAVHKVTLKNGQSSAITISSISTNLTDFSETNNCPMSPTTLKTGASCTISVTFTPSLQGARNGTLTVVDTGLSSPQLVTLTGTGTPPILQSIAVTPSTASVIVANTQQFTATGTYSDGSTQNLTTASWTSSTTSIATIGLHTGAAKGVSAGTSTITATLGKISGSAMLTVTATVLTSISVTPSTASVSAGKTQQYKATGTYNNGTTQNLTNTATWTSSATSVATISTSGLATTVVQGTTTITATSGTISGSATLTVTAAILASIAVTPSTASVSVGNTEQFTATGIYTDGTTKDLTTSASWTSSSTSVATIKIHNGLATSVAPGTTTITASLGTLHGSATLTVTAAALASISVTPSNASIAAGKTQQFTATGTYSDRTTQDLTTTATWTSSNLSFATVASGGLSTGVAQGTATITATSGTISGSATLTVTPATLTSISVSPANASIANGTNQQFAATGTYSDGSTQGLTTTVTWNSSLTTVASLTTSGLATGIGVGTATITASSGSITGSTTITVTNATLVSIAVTPAIPTVPLGTTQQFTATGTFNDSTTQNITGTVQWSTDTPAVATISNNAPTAGLATSLAQGTATISATSGPVSGSTTLTVTAAALASIAITPAAPSIALGTTQQFTATGTYTDGTTQNLTSTAAWSSNTPLTATINNAGLATSLAQGTATISASAGSVSGSTVLTVTAAALVSIAINPPTAAIALGTTQQFTATGTFSDGTTQDLTQSGQWSSTVATVATISNTAGSAGLATTLSTGSTTIGVASGSVSGTATLVVNPVALVSIAINPQSPTIALGTTQQFTATGTYTDGSTQDLTTVVTWGSSDATVAIISNAVGSNGLATSSGQGTATISATSNSISASTTMTVSAATLVFIALSPQSPTISLGINQQFTATGTYSDGSVQDVTNSVTWTSGTLTVATISNSSGSQGLATSVGVGTSSITATLGVVASTTLTVTQSVSTQIWTLHGPPGRSSHSAVYDPNSRQMIIFGGQSTTGTGLNDVWLGQTSTTLNDSFTAEAPSGIAPEGRYGHVATYDPNSNRMTIFGGGTGLLLTCLNDPWILTSANGQSGTPSWIAMSPSGTPPVPRVYSGGAYDPNTNSMIVFGGNNCSSGYLNDVWVLSNANGESGNSAWTQVFPSGMPPPAREGASAVYDSTNNILMIYGGDAGGGSPFGDVRVLSHANGTGGTPTWTQLSPTGTAPMARTGQTATYDSVNDRMTIFGGISGGLTLSDTWVLTSANGVGATPTWIQVATSGTTPSLAYHSAVYDQSANNMYIFAGRSSQDKLETNDHAFTLSRANGISSGEKWILGGPPVRYSHSAFYDSSTNRLFVFGGQHALNDIDFNDYWEAPNAIGPSDLQWTPVMTTGSKPTGRFGHTGLYDSGSNRMMVFGGATGFPAPCVHDYYVLTNANTQGGTPTWVSVSPTGTAPAVRTRHASVYDANSNTLIIFGGYDCNSTYYNDVWILQNANDLTGQPSWTQLRTTGSQPTGRESSSAVYDPTTNSLIVYGGDAGGAPMGDTWVLSHANGSGGTPAWTQLSTSSSGPAARSGHTATYDGVNNLMMIYGGFDGFSVLGDIWGLSAANGQAGATTWSQSSSGQGRRFHSSEYDPTSNQMITYGGATRTSLVPTSDIYTLTDANGLP